jgi:hypothetical protein
MVFIRILSLLSSLLKSSEGCFVNMVSSKSLNKCTESRPLLRDNATFAEKGVTGNFLVVPMSNSDDILSYLEWIMTPDLT